MPCRDQGSVLGRTDLSHARSPTCTMLGDGIDQASCLMMGAPLLIREAPMALLLPITPDTGTMPGTLLPRRLAPGSATAAAAPSRGTMPFAGAVLLGSGLTSRSMLTPTVVLGAGTIPGPPGCTACPLVSIACC